MASQLGPAWLWFKLAWPFENAPEVLEITNRYNENDGVSKRVHELAFGIVICFSWLQSVTSAAASEGGPLRVFLERKLCEICAQTTKDLGGCMPMHGPDSA